MVLALRLLAVAATLWYTSVASAITLSSFRRCIETALPQSTCTISGQGGARNRSSLETPKRRLSWWEHLPATTPVFDTEVAVWEYERPTFRKRCGHGFFGNDKQPIAPKEEQQEKPKDLQRDPNFMEKDQLQPLRLLCKSIGLIVAFPIYLLYLTFFKLVWVKPFCRLCGALLGSVLDVLIYLTDSTAWAIYVMFMAPIHCILIYMWRILRNGLLYLAKYILMPAEYFYLRAILPIQMLIMGLSRLVYYNFLLPFGSTMWAVLTAAVDGLSAGFLLVYNMICRVADLLLVHIIIPGYEGFVRGFCYSYDHIILPVQMLITALSRVVYYSFLLPFGSTIWAVLTAVVDGLSTGFLLVYNMICRVSDLLLVHIIIPGYEGFVSGFCYSYVRIILPIGKYLYTYLVRPIFKVILWIYKRVLSSVRWLSQSLIRPICEGIAKCITACHKYIFAPIGQLMQAIFVFVGVTMAAIAEALNEFILSPIRRSIQTLFTWTKAALAANVSAINSAFQAMRRALGMSQWA